MYMWIKKDEVLATKTLVSDNEIQCKVLCDKLDENSWLWQPFCHGKTWIQNDLVKSLNRPNIWWIFEKQHFDDMCNWICELLDEFIWEMYSWNMKLVWDKY